MKRIDVLRAGAVTAAGLMIPYPAFADEPKFIGAATAIEADSLPFLAQSQGYYARNGVSVDMTAMNSGEAIAASVVTGDTIIGSMNTVSLAVAHQNGIDVKILGAGALYDSRVPASKLMVKKDSPIKTGAQFNGKTVAVNVLRGSGHLAAQVWIDKNGGDSKTVKFVESSYVLMQAALEADRFDAAVISEPSATKALVSCRAICAPHAAIAPRWLIGTYIATGAWIAKNPDVARRVHLALRQTAQWYDADRAGSVAPVAALTKQDPSVVEHSIRAIFGLEATPALVQPVIDVAARYGVLKAPFPASEVIAKL